MASRYDSSEGGWQRWPDKDIMASWPDKDIMASWPDKDMMARWRRLGQGMMAWVQHGRSMAANGGCGTDAAGMQHGCMMAADRHTDCH